MKNKSILMFLIIFLLFFGFNFFSIINLDIMWNYGFSLNYSNNLLLYKDFNMVITPLYPIITGTFMKIFGNNLVSFYLINALFATLIIFIISKLNKNIIIPFTLIILLTSEPNYDLLSTLFLFILIYLEKEKGNDYLIGTILGLSFLTKSSIGVILSLISISYLKSPNKILKRFIGFLIPNLIIIILFLIQGNFIHYINYAFLGLFNFAKNNNHFNLITIISLSIVIFFIYKYIKTQDITNLYIGLYQIVCFPLFNISHLIESLIPIFYYFLNKYKKWQKYYKYTLFLYIIPFLFLIYNIQVNDCHYTSKPFNIKYIQKEYINDINILNNYFNNDFDNVIFCMYEGYLYHIMLNKQIDFFALPLKGNLGFKGEDNYINRLKQLKKGQYIVTSLIFQKGQSSEKIYNYIKNNYQLIAQFHKFNIYQVN